MPLRIELKPYERLIIGGAAIRNGPRRTSFVIETDTRFLRESDVITERDADTACKRLYLTLEVIYLTADPAAENAFFAQANEIMAAVPSMAPHLRDVHDHLAAGEPYRALKRAKEMVAYEAELRARLPAAE